MIYLRGAPEEPSDSPLQPIAELPEMERKG